MSTMRSAESTEMRVLTTEAANGARAKADEVAKRARSDNKSVGSGSEWP